MRRPCPFCFAPADQIVKGQCRKCKTSIPAGSKSNHRNSKAYPVARKRLLDEDANGYWANVVKELDD